MNEKLSDLERDELVEMICIGAGNASVALSQMVNKKVDLKVPEAFVDKIENIAPIFGELDELRTMILLKMSGDTAGIMLLSLPTESAAKLASLLTGNPETDIQSLGELEKSALREVSNILSGSSFTAFSKFLGIEFQQSVPEVVTDMLGAMVNSIMAESYQDSDEVLLFRSHFEIEGESVEGRLVFLFDPPASRKILAATDKKISS